MSAQLPVATLRRAAATIVNARIASELPQMKDVLANVIGPLTGENFHLIGTKLTADVLDDAKAVADELHLADVLSALQRVHEGAFVHKWPGDERAAEAVKQAIAALDPNWRGSW